MGKKEFRKKYFGLLVLSIFVIVLIGVAFFRMTGNVIQGEKGINLILAQFVPWEDINWTFTNVNSTVVWYNETFGGGYGYNFWLHEVGIARYKTDLVSTKIYPGEKFSFNADLQQTNYDGILNFTMDLVDEKNNQILFRANSQCLGGLSTGGKTIIQGKSGTFKTLYTSPSQYCYKLFSHNSNVIITLENEKAIISLKDLNYQPNVYPLFTVDNLNNQNLTLKFSIYGKSSSYNYFYIRNFSGDVLYPEINSRPEKGGDLWYLDKNYNIKYLPIYIFNAGYEEVSGDNDIKIEAVLKNKLNQEIRYEGTVKENDIGKRKPVYFELFESYRSFTSPPIDIPQYPYTDPANQVADVGNLYNMTFRFDTEKVLSRVINKENIRICAGGSDCYRELNKVTGCSDSDIDARVSFNKTGEITFNFTDNTSMVVVKDYCTPDGMLVETSCKDESGSSNYYRGYYWELIDCNEMQWWNRDTSVSIFPNYVVPHKCVAGACVKV